MPKPYQTQKKVRSLREEVEVAPQVLPRVHRKFLLALLEAAICEGVPFYVGRTYKDGRLTYKLYTDREVLETFIAPGDDPATQCSRVAVELWGPAMADQVLAQGSRLEAQERLQEAKRPDPKA